MVLEDRDRGGTHSPVVLVVLVGGWLGVPESEGTVGIVLGIAYQLNSLLI